MNFTLFLVFLSAIFPVDAFITVTRNSSRRIPSTNIHSSQDDGSFDASNTSSSPGIDSAWRYIKKPLLRIGGKGASESHGNSLRELLNAHTAVKVKVNTKKLGSLEDAFEEIKGLAEKGGKISGIELIHIRPSDNVIMFGKEGTHELIRTGQFPPPLNEE